MTIANWFRCRTTRFAFDKLDPFTVATRTENIEEDIHNPLASMSCGAAIYTADAEQSTLTRRFKVWITAHDAEKKRV